MVHALKEVRRLLKPDGYLIDIHPIRKAPLIKVYQKSDLLYTASDPGYDYDEALRHADEALDEVVRQGLFHIEGRNEFEMVLYTSSVAEMRDYWEKYGAFDDEQKEDAITARQNDIYARVDEIMQNAPGSGISYHEQAHIMRLKPGIREL